MNKPDTAGLWTVEDTKGVKIQVLVECGSASGIYCKTLKMGGSSHCGFNDWDRTLKWTKNG